MPGQMASHVLLPSSKCVDISFENVKYSVPVSSFSKDKKQILKGLSGQFRAGELTAIMGPSGAGKSSLLNVLSGFVKKGIEGSIYANKEELDAKRSLIKNHCAYIMQNDYLNPLFSVMEIMYHAANLKLGPAISHKSKKLLIEDILENMGMAETGNTLCCRLSGGQKKRLNVCLELINNPPIFYLDEPTSGLDSSSCSLLISKLKGLARSGRTVICTIHQPSAGIFMQFDHLYLISAGRTVYQGCSTNIVPFLDGVGFPCPLFHNPADFVMDVIVGEFGNCTDKLIAATNNNDWRKVSSDQMSNTVNEIKALPLINSLNNDNENEQPSEWYRYIIITQRISVQLHRDWTKSYLKLFLHICVGFILGLLFQNFGNNGSKLISNISYFYITIMYLCFTSMMPAALTFPSEMMVLKKEHFNNWYRFTTYFFALLSVHIPIQLIFTGVFTSISYMLTGQVLEINRIILFGLAIAFNTIISELIGITMGAMAHPVNGVFNGSVLLAIYSLVGGFFIFLKDIPSFIYILTYLGSFRYVFEVLVMSQYGFGRGRLECPKDLLYCHFRNVEILTEETMGLSENNILKDFGILTLYTLSLGFFTYLRVRYRLKTFH